MKTSIVKFTYGTAKDAELLIPTGEYNLYQLAQLLRASYLMWAFRPGCGLMSDEVLLSSIGKADYFAGALGGFKTRLDAEAYAELEKMVNYAPALALAIVRTRRPGLSLAEQHRAASQNTALDPAHRRYLAECARLFAAEPAVAL